MALGHWLKDYIGPNSASESGGGTVEVEKIKIASVNGGYNSLGQSVCSFAGGGLTVDGKTLSEILGNKTVINVLFVVNNSFAIAAEYHFSVDSQTYSLLGLNGNDEVASKQGSTYMSINGLIPFTPSSTVTIDIYAICI